MTVHTVGTNSPTVFDAGLPSIGYEHAQNADEAHRLIRQARVQGPIALGPHGPEVLSYPLVRTVLRDPRFCMPKGVVLAAQGITSGRLWDKATTGLLSLDGADHNRLRRLVCKAFTASVYTLMKLLGHESMNHLAALRQRRRDRNRAPAAQNPLYELIQQSTAKRPTR
jgi:cytochrome P450